MRNQVALQQRRLVPYSFRRHTYSLRGHRRGIDAGAMAHSMGHSLEVLDGTASVESVLRLAHANFPDVNDDVLRRDIIDFVYNLFQWGYIQGINLPGPSGYFSPTIAPIDEADGRSGCGACKESYV